ncbi:uncharacterized protein LOC131927658 [Physella acuta]|uniref:uncharacterized protein LOC131927658 n=1 Tax=Physella acuta TaxID=109671 RepID=UPI0027DD8B40|nr:uncharacterized protein LOC131927658 [Physella acuta]
MAEYLSRHELKILHRKVVSVSKDLQGKHTSMRELLKDINDGFIEIQCSCPLFRSCRLPRLVRQIVSAENLKNIRQWLDDSSIATLQFNETTGLKAFFDKIELIKKNNETADEDDSHENESRPLITGRKPLSKGRQAIRKLKKISGLIDEKLEDEDVMTDAQLKKHLNKLQRRNSYYHGEVQRAYQALNSLNTVYEESLSCCMCFSYFRLKDAVSHVMQATRADSSYQE